MICLVRLGDVHMLVVCGCGNGCVCDGKGHDGGFDG